MGCDIPGAPHGGPQRHVVAVARIVFALRRNDGVHGDDQRVDPGAFRPVDQPIGEGAVPPEIQLEPDIAFRLGGNLFDGGNGFRGRAKGNARLGRRARQTNLALVPEQSRSRRRRDHKG